MYNKKLVECHRDSQCTIRCWESAIGISIVTLDVGRVP